jgi:hypothetical protein
VTALAPLAHCSGAGEGDMLDMCGVGVEATWTACEAVATAWACHQGGVVLRQERLDRRVTCGLCHGCECVYPHVCCRVVCWFGHGDACLRCTQLSSRGRYDFALLF